MDEIDVLRLLFENPSVAAVCQRGGLDAGEVTALKAEVGRATAWYQDRVLTGLNLGRVHIDVSRTFSGEPGAGDIWTWIAMEPHSRLVLSWLVGDRDRGTARAFIDDVAGRLTRPAELVVDDERNAYLEATDGARAIDESLLTDLYGLPKDGGAAEPTAPTTDARHLRCHALPRLAPGFAALIEDHTHGLALAAMLNNFVRIRDELGTAPAVITALIDAPWQADNIADVLRMWRALRTGPWYERLVVLPKR